MVLLDKVMTSSYRLSIVTMCLSAALGLAADILKAYFLSASI